MLLVFAAGVLVPRLIMTNILLFFVPEQRGIAGRPAGTAVPPSALHNREKLGYHTNASLQGFMEVA
jgi:hypothetical protein